MANVKRLHISVYDDIPYETALRYVSDVVGEGRISKKKTMYCYLTEFNDPELGGVFVNCVDYRKSDCFKVYLKNRK